MNDHTIKVKTSYNKDVIEQSILNPSEDLITQTTKRILYLQEQGVRDALKKLGWLSPDEAKELIDAAGGIRSWREGTKYYEECEDTFVRIAEAWYNRNKENN